MDKMVKIINEVLENIDESLDMESKFKNIMEKYNKYIILNHSIEVSQEAMRLADIFGYDSEKARIAGLLHDIGGIYPNNERINISKALEIEILREEEELPLILHQKISKILSTETMMIKDDEILSAIECHTTLKNNPSKLDMIIFIADKLKWDQNGEPPYKEMVLNGLGNSLEKGVFEFMDYQIKNGNLKVIHPWFKEGYLYLKAKISR